MKKTFEKACYANHMEGKIFMTEKFLKAAGSFGSPEFEWFIGLKKMCPEYEVVKFESSSKKKNDYNGLSIEKMIAFYDVHKKERREIFERYIDVYTDEKTMKIEKGRYATIKRLFLDECKEQYNNLSSEEITVLDGKAKEIKKQREENRVAKLRKDNIVPIKSKPEEVVEDLVEAK